MVKKFFNNSNVLAIFAGIVHAFIFEPFNSLIAAFFSICLFYHINLRNENKPWKLALFFGFPSCLISLYWIINSLLLDLENLWLLIPLAVISIPLFFSLYYLIVTVPFFYIKQRIVNPILLAMVFSLLWMISEIAKSYLFTGFPFNLIGSVLLDYESISQIIFYTNIFVLGFLAILFYLLIFNVVFTKSRTLSAGLILLFIISIICFHKFDNYKLLSDQSVKTDSINIRIVQPNVAQKFKWNKDDVMNNIINLYDLSFQEGKNNFVPELIIWPETAWPFAVDTNKLLEDVNFMQLIENLDKKQILVAGIIRIDNKKTFNSLITLQNSNQPIVGVYDKKHLVPFGEFIPFFNFIQRISPSKFEFFRLLANLDFGNKNQPNTKIFDNIEFSSLICYEGIFPYKLNHDVKFVVNLTNDGWFGKSAGPYQHLRSVRIQAIKSNISVIRVANTGISAVINNRGKIIKKIDLLERGILDWNIKI